MKQKLVFALGLLLLLCISSTHLSTSNYATADSAVTTSWSKTFEDGGALDIASTSDGGYIILCMVGTANMLIKLDAEGNTQWQQTIRNYHPCYVKSIIETSDGGYAYVGTNAYATGQEINGFLLTKTDSQGNVVWKNTFGENGNVWEGNDLIQSSDGSYIVVGDCSGKGWDFLVVKIDTDGNKIWNYSFNGPNLPNGGDDRASSIVQAEDGYVIAGCTSISGNYPIYWLVKIDSSGEMKWQKTYSTSIWDWAYAVTKTIDGGYALAGESSDSFWVVKTDADGNEQWNKNYGYATNWVCSIIQTNDGGYAITGRDKEFNLIKTDSFGNQKWTYYLNSSLIYSVVESSDGGLVLSGSYNSSIWVAKIIGPGTAVTAPTVSHTETPFPSAEVTATLSSQENIFTSINLMQSLWIICLIVVAIAVVSLVLGYFIGVRKTEHAKDTESR